MPRVLDQLAAAYRPVRLAAGNELVPRGDCARPELDPAQTGAARPAAVRC